MEMLRRSLLGALVAAPLVLASRAFARDTRSSVVVDGGPYVPTPHGIVARMLELAGTRRGDILFDLGSGDGRLVIEAARRGARGIGVERDEELVERARTAAREAGVADRVEFRKADIFEANLRSATVVTMYLLPPMMERLGPKLLAELAPGTRVVAHDFPLATWPAAQVLDFDDPEKEAAVFSAKTQLFLYVVPPPA
jgi:precorrin-6B methylase 2